MEGCKCAGLLPAGVILAIAIAIVHSGNLLAVFGREYSSGTISFHQLTSYVEGEDVEMWLVAEVLDASWFQLDWLGILHTYPNRTPACAPLHLPTQRGQRAPKHSPYMSQRYGNPIIVQFVNV